MSFYIRNAPAGLQVRIVWNDTAKNAALGEEVRDVAVDDLLGQAFHDGRLADTRLADEHRVVLGAAREHLDDAADLLVAADDRIELALAREIGEVLGVPLQRLVLVFGVGIGDPLTATHLDQ